MIRVSHLTRRFPGCTAVDDVSFEVERGEIVGFLGPNGAGKTTTLRILAGFLPATSGTARVAGYDVVRESLEVRRRIGYLPENTPLYPEMRVGEYLRYRARLKGLRGSSVRRRVREVTDRCGLTDVERHLIGALSKGYRQRVGLADGLVHEPELLILDEPTIGLDPNQVRQVRELIQELAQRHTILLSTHILSEVELSCRRVLIIHRGKIIASDTPAALREHRAGRVWVELAGPAEEMARGLGQVPGVIRVTLETPGEWAGFSLDVEAGADPRAALFELASARGWTLRELRQEKTSLEDVFASLTRSGSGGPGA